MFFAFIGVLIIGLSGSQSGSEDGSHDAASSQSMFMFGLLFAVIAALSQSIVAVSSRVLKQVNSSVIMFNYGST